MEDFNGKVGNKEDLGRFGNEENLGRLIWGVTVMGWYSGVTVM
jgi:hypothetical protein